MENLQFISTTPEKLVELINISLDSKLEELSSHIQKHQAKDDLLTRAQACELLQIDSSSLWRWTKSGKIKAYGIANRRYYKRSELMEALKPLLG